jgi:hypothetical protein
LGTTIRGYFQERGPVFDLCGLKINEISEWVIIVEIWKVDETRGKNAKFFVGLNSGR